MSDEWYTFRQIGARPGDFVQRPLSGPGREIDNCARAADQVRDAADRLKHDPVLHRDAVVRPAAGKWLSPDAKRRVRALELEISRLKTQHALKMKIKSYYMTQGRSCSLATISGVLAELQELEQQIGGLQARLTFIVE
jgi:hypothetical protein